MNNAMKHGRGNTALKRRAFVGGLIVGGTGLVAGGVFGHRTFARNTLQQQLLAKASPVLTNKALSELDTIPSKGREAIREYFHGLSFKAVDFVEVVCSNAFRERLHALPEDQQKRLLLMTYTGRVAPESEIANRVRDVSTRAERDMAANWVDCCHDLCDAWNIYIREIGPGIETEQFTSRMDTLLDQSIDNILGSAQVAASAPAFAETAGLVGDAFRGLLPWSEVECEYEAGPLMAGGSVKKNTLVIPTAILNGLYRVFDYVIGLLFDPRDDLQRLVSSEISDAGNRIASEFESSFRQCLVSIHDWQQLAVQASAKEYAESRIGLF